MKNTSSYIVITLGSLLILFSCKAEQKDMTSQVKAFNKIFSKAMVEQDYDAQEKMYTDDCYVLPSYSKISVGKEELKNNFKMDQNSGMTYNSFDLKTIKVERRDDLVIEIGAYSLDMNVPGMDMPFKDNGKYVVVYKVDENDSLKIYIDIWNTDSNPWEMMKGQGKE